MNAPTVSVILPTYHRAALLGRAIASVLAQSYRDLELIVVDDAGRPDPDTAAVVAGFADPRLRYLPPERNRGDAGARNRGIEQARGAWLAFQDSDDEWLPDKLALQMARLAESPAAVAACGSTLLRYVRGPGTVEVVRWPLNARGEVCPQRFLAGFTAFLQSLVVRTERCRALGGFNTEIKARSDFEFCLRLLQEAPMVAVDLPLVLSHETPDSISGRADYRLHDIRRILALHGERIRRQPAAEARYRYDLARTLAMTGQTGPAAAELLRALRRRPTQLRSWALLAALPLGARRLQALAERRQRARGLAP